MRWTVALLLLGVAFAGCADDAEPDQRVAPSYEVTGTVVSSGFNPIKGATVTLGQGSHCWIEVRDDEERTFCTEDWQITEATTDADGRFTLTDIWGGPKHVTVTADGFLPGGTNLTVPGDELQIRLVAEVDPAYTETFPFKGYFECGADHLIFAGSCDEFVGAVVEPVEGTFADEREFFVDLSDDWRTIVIDVGFETLPPGLEALRLAAYAPGADAEVLDYQRYAAASGAGPFTMRIEPGVDYGDELPAPDNATTIRFEVFPQGYGYQQICDPTETSPCFTGLGLSARIDFELIVTVFYRESAPDGWSLLG